MSVPEIKSETSTSYKRVHVGGVFGGIVPAGLEAVFYSEAKTIEKVLQTQPLSVHKMELKRVAEVELLLDPMQMKSIHQWLGEKIKEYEQLFGNIPSPEEVESRARRTAGQ